MQESLDFQNNSEDLSALSFEEALSALEIIVRQLESGKVKLEDAVSAYERGIKLKNICEEKLKAAKSKIDLLVISSDGKPVGVESFDEQING